MNTPHLNQYQDSAYALLRMFAGFLFFWHGTHKFFNFPIEFPYPLSPIMVAAGSIELLTGVLIMIGIAVRPSAFLASGTMAVGYWMFHGTNSILPIANNGELSALFCFVFLYIACHGPGKWSLSEIKKS